MIDIKAAPDNVVAIRLLGELSAQDIGSVRKAVEDRLSGGRRIGVVVDFSGFDDATEDAIRADLKFEMVLIPQVSRFGRMAIVSDKTWLKFTMKQAARLLPSMELRSFEANGMDHAIAWAAGVSAQKPSSHAFHRIGTSESDVYAFEINGTISSDEMPAVTTDIEAFLSSHTKVKVLGRIEAFGFDPAILMQKSLLAMKIAALGKVERYALVGGPAWMQSAVKVMGQMMPGMEVKAYSRTDEGKAWDWIGAKAA